MAPAPRRPMSLPGLQQPVPGQRSRPPLAWADGGTTGITNLGQPCRKHHGLKHGSGWTPSGASKDKPPGWTSPSGRYYPSEQQDWEPPDWPPDLLPAGEGVNEEGPPADDGPGQDVPPDPGSHPDPDPELALTAYPGWNPDLDLPADPGWDPDLDLPPDPGRDPNLAMPPDPFTDWYLFTAGHPCPTKTPTARA